MAIICGNCDHEVEYAQEVWVPTGDALFVVPGQRVRLEGGFQSQIVSEVDEDGYVDIRAPHCITAEDRVHISTLTFLL